MADYSELKQNIASVIKSNNRREITGQILQNVLNQMVGSLGENYQLAGFAEPTTNPQQPDQTLFYIAEQAGVYTNFDNITLGDGLSFLMWKNSEWTSHTIGVATHSWVESNYVSKAFLRQIFRVYDADGFEILPNNTTSIADNIKAMVGLWTNQYLSALGLGDDGQTGAQYLTQLGDVDIDSETLADGQVLVYDNGLWVNGQAGGVDMSVVWSALAGNTNEQINASHLTTALTGYVTSSSLSTTLADYVTTTALNTALASYASQSWVSQNYVSIAFLNRILRAYDSTNTQVEPNDTTTAIDNLKAMVGLWTEQYLSALGQGNDGGGGGYITTLGQLEDVQLTTPSVGQALVYAEVESGVYKWVNGSAGVDMNSVWTALAGGTNEQIALSHLTTALSGYVTTSGLSTTLADYVTATALSTTLADYVTATSLSTTLASYATQQWVGQNYVSIAFFNRLFAAYDSSNVIINPNDTTTAVDNIKALVGLWTQQYLSALGQGSDGGGGGQGDVTWALLADNTDTRQIALSHLTSALTGYATTSQLANYLPLSGGTITTSYQKTTFDNSGIKINTSSNTSIVNIGSGSSTPLSGQEVGILQLYDNGSEIHRLYAYANNPSWLCNATGSNLGIGTDTPSYKLHVNGTAYATSFVKANGTSSQFLKADGSVDSNTYATTTSLANYLPLSGGGTVTTTNFHTVVGSGINIKTASDTRIAYIGSGSSSPIAGTELGILQLFNNSNEVVRIYARTADDSWINSARLGIGTDSPSYKLHVVGDVYTTGGFKKSGSDNSYVLLGGGGHSNLKTINGNSIFGTGDITVSGGGGGNYLPLSGGVIDNNGAPYWSLTINSTGNGGTSNVYLGCSDGDGLAVFTSKTGTSSYLANFANANGSVMYIRHDGNIGIGVTTPSYKLHVNGDIYATSSIRYGSLVMQYDNEINSANFIHLNYRTTGIVSICNGGGNVGIGTTSPSYKLHVSGDIYATGGVTSLSDIRKKDVISYELPLSVEQIANAPTIRFTWKDCREGGEQVGTIAQYWEKVLPEVTKNKSGELSMGYGVTALIAATIDARKIVDHEKRLDEQEALIREQGIKISELQNECADLRRENEMLKLKIA